MKVMILAAGLGERMRALTTNTPKPLLKVNDRCLIEYHLDALAKAGFKDIVINVCSFSEKIKEKLRDGSSYGVRIQYSEEPSLLDTGGGIYNALPLLDNDHFLVVNSDLWTDYPFQKLQKSFHSLAHLILVDNPEYHPLGDFHLDGEKVIDQDTNLLTFSGIAVYHPDLFIYCHHKKTFPIATLLYQAVTKQQITGERYSGLWMNVGTPEQLDEANQDALNRSI